MRLALFVTCLVDLMRPSIGFASLRLLESAGCEVVVPPGQTCCGQPAWNAGNRGLARNLARKAIAELEGYPETGWAFTPDAWGRGYATEAMIAVLDWADHVARIPETRCIIDPGNAASHRVAAKLGYVQFAHSEGAIGPVHVYARKSGDKAGD